MPVKILSRAGVSLADTYDVVGSIAGVEELDSESVKVVHEMGSTMFSERFSTTIRRRSTGAIAQNIAINEIINDLPATPQRILGVQVITDDASRLDRLVVSVRDGVASREIPIFLWDGTNSNTIRLDDDGTLADVELLRPIGNLNVLTPSFVGGGGQPQTVPEIAMRSLTTGFGAGTVTVTLLLYLAFSQVGGLSSLGLPIPSW